MAMCAVRLLSRPPDGPRFSKNCANKSASGNLSPRDLASFSRIIKYSTADECSEIGKLSQVGQIYGIVGCRDQRGLLPG